MFNLLVESTNQSRRHTPKYFLLTFLAYASIMGAAVVGSIMFYKPALADTFDTLTLVAPPPPQAPGGPSKPQQQGHKAPTQVVVSNIAPRGPIDPTPRALPTSVVFDQNINSNSTGPGIGPGGKDGIQGGIPVSSIIGGPPPIPETLPPAPERKNDVAKPDNRIYKVSEVRPGKAINIPTPPYPVLAKQMHLEGQVKVELVVDKSGHVVSAVAVDGPALLRPAAVNAALRSTFQPTYLSGEPVMIQAYFTFNFKLNN